MGNEFCMVINNTGHDIVIRDWTRCFSKDNNTWEELPLGESHTLRPPKLYVRINASEFYEESKTIEDHVASKREKRVSVTDQDSKEGVVLSVCELLKNKAIVFNKGKDDQLVKELVSKEDVKKRLGVLNYFLLCNNEQMKTHCISVVNERNNAASSQPQAEATKPHGDTAQDRYSELENELWPEPTVCAERKYILLKNEICDVFKKLFGPGNDGIAEDNILPDTHKKEMSLLNVIADKMETSLLNVIADKMARW